MPVSCCSNDPTLGPSSPPSVHSCLLLLLLIAPPPLFLPSPHQLVLFADGPSPPCFLSCSGCIPRPNRAGSLAAASRLLSVGDTSTAFVTRSGRINDSTLSARTRPCPKPDAALDIQPPRTVRSPQSSDGGSGGCEIALINLCAGSADCGDAGEVMDGGQGARVQQASDGVRNVRVVAQTDRTRICLWEHCHCLDDMISPIEDVTSFID